MFNGALIVSGIQNKSIRYSVVTRLSAKIYNWRAGELSGSIHPKFIDEIGGDWDQDDDDADRYAVRCLSILLEDSQNDLAAGKYQNRRDDKSSHDIAA